MTNTLEIIWLSACALLIAAGTFGIIKYIVDGIKEHGPGALLDGVCSDIFRRLRERNEKKFTE